MSRFIRFSVIAASSAFLSVSAGAETIEDVLATAYNSSPTLLAARASLRSTDEQVPLALSGWRPSVIFNGDVGRGQYFSNFSPYLPYVTERNVGDSTLVATQPLYSGGRTVAQTAQAENAVKAGRAQLEQTENQVLLGAATAYLDVARDQSLLNLNINNEHVLSKDLEMARERFAVGETTRTDVAQAEARLAQANALRMAAEGSLQASRANFVAIIGRPPELPEAVAASPVLPQSLDQAKVVAESANPGVMAANWQAQAAREAVDAVEGELLPTLALQGTYGRNVNEMLDGYQGREASGILKVSIPLYEGGGTYARIRAQKQVWGQRLIEVDRAKRDAVQSVTLGWELALAAHSRVAAYTSQIAASELALTGVKEESKVGARTVIEVLNAEQELFAAKVNAVVARHDEWSAAYQLRTAMGEMSAKALALPVDFYDAASHYDDVRGKWLGIGP